MLCYQLTNEHGGPACVGASMGGIAALAASLTANMSALVLVVGDCSMSIWLSFHILINPYPNRTFHHEQRQTEYQKLRILCRESESSDP